MGSAFEELVRALLLKRNDGSVITFRFSRIGGFWTREGDVEIDIVATDEEGRIFFGECKLNGSRFTRAEAARLKGKAGVVKWHPMGREEHYALFCVDAPQERTMGALRAEGVAVHDLKSLVEKPPLLR